MFENLPTPVIFAHRGASAHAPENTLTAFELAVKQGAVAIELDAMLCASGEVVVIHDDTLERTTNGRGKVNETPLSTLQSLDAGAFFAPDFAGERIPTLEQVFETLGRRVFINVELKNYASPRDDLPERVAALVRQHGLEDWVMFSSFNPLALRRAQASLPKVPVGLLTTGSRAGRLLNALPGRLLVAYAALHPERSAVDAGLVQAVHRRGKRLHVYTVNRPEEAGRLFALGVDGIFSDDPLILGDRT
ncbi:MAG: glycerophosphodiester phosphodiesterase [Anaerolineales bacterium]